MKIIFFIYLILFTTNLFSQNNFKYLGTLILSNNKHISFSINLNELDGIVKGYSITNLNTADETKSEISGLYFNEDKSFQIQETKILKTHSEAPINSFCYLNMNLFLNDQLVKKQLKGNFVGNFLDGRECARGNIIMFEEKLITKTFNNVKKISKRKKKNNQDSVQFKTTKTLKDEDDFIIFWKGRKLLLYIWDDNDEDGDKIELKINNNLILENFETKNKRKKIQYRLKKGENIINIKAINTGNSPPNTSKIELIDNKNKYSIITQLKLDKTAEIKIIVE